MPRLNPRMLKGLPLSLRLLMLPNNGILQDAKMEYRWIQEYHGLHNRSQILKSCRERGRFVPLQFILSNAIPHTSKSISLD